MFRVQAMMKIVFLFCAIRPFHLGSSVANGKLLTNLTPATTTVNISLEIDLKITVCVETTIDPVYVPLLPSCENGSGPTIYDCNRAFYNLGFEDGFLRTTEPKVSQRYEGCQIDVTCGGAPVRVSSGRLLHDVDSQKSGGYLSMSKTCLAAGQRGKVVVSGGCILEARRVKPKSGPLSEGPIFPLQQ
ncbi:hypothetical protein CROQUDRAFT_673290 [Cronartium quercuum f. sp. fusiforme G11]|uniref:Uncharacterized protein n=1 Tax=Cronartium quercuum f. sp. fusiforme G11 TaxID=708437 RepID=A0A9P6NB21_9BASI|nr:hypothetical protein CROQUDRAFT_673290 [Cronartium quercuum f. sp. fusiforme G11]